MYTAKLVAGLRCWSNTGTVDDYINGIFTLFDREKRSGFCSITLVAGRKISRITVFEVTNIRLIVGHIDSDPLIRSEEFYCGHWLVFQVDNRDLDGVCASIEPALDAVVSILTQAKDH
jgi:hypothetical protein